MWVPRHSIFRRLRFSFTVMAVIMYGGGRFLSVGVHYARVTHLSCGKVLSGNRRTASKANFASSNVL